DFFKYFTETFSGLGIREKDVHRVINEVDVDPEKPAGWSDEGLLRFTKALRKNTMPMVIAANKVDIDNAEENIERMKKEFPELKIVPTSSMAELFLKNLSQEGIVEYIPGDSSFKVLRQEKLNSKYQKALEIIEETVFKLHSSTGVQEAMNIAVLDVLDKIVVFPVEDETRLSDKKGNVLPDAILLGKGSTPRDLAYKIHTDIGRNFIAAINPRTKMKISSDKELEHLDIVKVIANA
ncbi:MAG TPA: TGS domain-containing protein, partial [Euryarchaeota archaeon]|nr:TGS domain-containing protein [Euryarchaeota archaeon]